MFVNSDLARKGVRVDIAKQYLPAHRFRHLQVVGKYAFHDGNLRWNAGQITDICLRLNVYMHAMMNTFMFICDKNDPLAPLLSDIHESGKTGRRTLQL